MERGWWDRTSDEVSSWFGDENAERRRHMDARRDEADRYYGRRYYGQGDRERFYSDSADYYPAQFYARDWHHLRAGDVMTRGVATVHPDDSAQHAAQMMGDCDCGAIPVVDWQNRMIGMVTDRDIAIRLVANGMNPARARVDDCMTDEVFACHVDDPLENCMRAMSRHQIRRLPILDDRSRVVGIVSQADIAQHAAENRGAGERRAVTDVLCAVSEPTRGSYS
jgi:CBS domain-containing protein